LIEIEDDVCGAEGVTVVGLKVLVCLAIANGSVFRLVACSVRGTLS
jgi:hypothetical protein